MKKLIALLLSVVMCFTLFAGCSKEEVQEEPTPAVIDYDAAFAKYDPDTVVMTIDGSDVTWSEFFYMMYSSLSQIQYYLGDVYWDQECVKGLGLTFDEYAMDMTMTMLKQLHAVDKKAKEQNLTLTQEDLDLIANTKKAIMQQNCGEDATEEDFQKFLLENVYLTEDVYNFVNENNLMYEKVFVETVGEQGEKVADEDVRAYIESVPYITVKHILLMTVDQETGEALSDDAIAEAKETAEQLLKQLQGITDHKKLEKTFDNLMKEYNQDPGVEIFPGGYTFTTGEMYAEFEEAAFALDEYEVSDIVESQAGYHIILRVPTTRESIVDLDYQTYTYYNILTYAAADVFSQRLTEWMDDCKISWKGDFKNITTEEIFS